MSNALTAVVLGLAYASLFLLERALPLRRPKERLLPRLLVNVAVSLAAFATAAALVRPAAAITLDFTGINSFGLLPLAGLTGATEITVAPTAAGMLHPATQLAPNDSATATLWRQMPPLTTVNEVGRPKPGATVLLEGKAEGDRRARPTLTYQRYGRGKAIVFAVQDSWLWQMHQMVPVEDQRHETFWRQMLRWLVDGVPSVVDVRTNADRIDPGETVTVDATVVDPQFVELNDATVVAQVTRPDGTSGHLYAVAQIVVPTVADERQRALYRQLQDASTFNPRAHLA